MIMAPEFTFSFPRYLSSKKTVDDRALNRVVIERFKTELHNINDEHPRILEIGAGIGSMIDRLVDWDILKKGHYVALDSMDENIIAAKKRLLDWAKSSHFDVLEKSGSPMTIQSDSGIDLQVDLITGDVFDFIETLGGKTEYDVLLSNAFLDLIDMDTQLASILGLLKSGGLYYFTINFDGSTVFQPEIDRELDDRIESLYHHTMDDRITNGRKSGDSRAGRHLFNNLLSSNCPVLEAGSSDWIVAPVESRYRHDEKYFLRFIVETVGSALKDNPKISQAELNHWLEIRRNQIDRNELFYMAHQLDYVGRKRG